MLKLVYVNPNPLPIRQSTAFEEAHPREGTRAGGGAINLLPHFTAKLSRIDAGRYQITLTDPSHYLSCVLSLETRESDDESAFGDVICHFPIIQDQYLRAFVWEDATLKSLILLQFHIKVLEQLLLFCATYNALKLVIHANPRDANLLEAYEGFIVHTDQILTPQGRKMAFVIPTDRAAQDKLADYREQTSLEFHGTLLEEQQDNPVIGQYLKLSLFN